MSIQNAYSYKAFLDSYYMAIAIVEEWDVWPRGPRLQGEDAGKAGAREQQRNKTKEYHRPTSQQDIGISVGLYKSHEHYTRAHTEGKGKNTIH
jgi:hypothetical protein